MARAICVLGMHRSGTSLLARLLHGLGVDFGVERDHLAPNFANPDGYFELEVIVQVHDAILQRFARRWDTAFPLPAGWNHEPGLEQLRPRLESVVRATFGDAETFGWKDPRTCLTLALWKELLDELGIPVHFVLIFRNPLDVALSLARRNGFEPREALGIWYAYNLEILTETAGRPRSALAYEDLLDHPAGELARIASELGLRDDVPELETLVDGSRCHSRSTPDEVSRRSPSPVSDLYAAIEVALVRRGSWADLEAEARGRRNELRRWAELLGHDARAAWHEVGRLREVLEGTSWGHLDPWFTTGL